MGTAEGDCISINCGAPPDLCNNIVYCNNEMIGGSGQLSNLRTGCTPVN